MEQLFIKLANSKFRSRFKLTKKYIDYIDKNGFDKIRLHAKDFVIKNLSKKDIVNDGKQTPMKGHPVFIAQHATATCCRGCLYKWHKIVMDTTLNEKEIDYIVDVIMYWINKEYKKNK